MSNHCLYCISILKFSHLCFEKNVSEHGLQLFCALVGVNKYVCRCIILLLLSNKTFSLKGTSGISTWCQPITPKEAASLQDGFFQVSPQTTLGPLLSDNLEINYFIFEGR